MEIFHVLTLKLMADQSDQASGLLFNEGCLGLEETDIANNSIALKAYFSESTNMTALMDVVAQQLNPVTCSYSSHKTSEAQFKPAPFNPIQLAGNYWIVPPDDMPCEEPLKEGHPLVIRPGMAFGTGRHETTQLVSEFIVEMYPKPSSFLDVGTGSGVLAILAAKEGFAPIETVEIDEQAWDNARENFELNGLQNIPLHAHLQKVTQKFDCIVANILAPILIQLKPELLKLLNDKGLLILSGILEEEKDQVIQAYKDIPLIEEKSKDVWVALKFEH